MNSRRPSLLIAISEARGPVALRFWSKVDARGPDECWLWTRCRDGWGYGSFSISKRTYIASRVAWALAKGTDPGEFLVCHTCDNPACCNPRHLWLGTVADNSRDMLAKGRGIKGPSPKTRRGERCPHAKLTEDQVRAIRKDPRSLRKIASEYGVGETTIHNARTGRNWRHVPMSVAA